MIDFAKILDIRELKTIWTTCFSESLESADFFYQNGFIPSNTLVWREAKKPIAMLTLMPVTFNSQQAVPGFYIYAIATLPNYQKRGIMKELIFFAEQVIKERNGKFSCLVPAKEELFALYKTLGYQSVFQINTEWIGQFGQEQFDRVIFSPCSYEQFKELRNQYLSARIDSIHQNEHFLLYAYREILFYGGDILFYKKKDESHYLVCSDLSDGLLIRECSDEAPQKEILSLLEQKGKQKALLRTPFKQESGLQGVNYGMYKPLDIQIAGSPYMSLMMD